jgi:hypothetical protein
MIKNRNNIVSKKLETNDLKETFLSIQISLDGFSFSVYDSIAKDFLAFYEYSFHLESTSPEKILTPIKAIFEENELLQHPHFKKVFVSYANTLSTLVPKVFFDSDKKHLYLENTVKVFPSDFISHDELSTMDAIVVYIPFVNINNFLFSKFGSFEYQHASSLLIDYLLKTKAFPKNEKAVAVNVYASHFETLVWNGKKLIFYNTFSFKTAEDFIYYLLFVFEQFELDTNTIQTFFMGEIEKESALYKIAYQYIRQVSFLQLEELSSDFKPLGTHSHITLLHQF